MSARDDYRAVDTSGGVELLEADYWRMIDEVDRLRGWKAEAIQVIGMWEECYDVLDQAGQGARLGEFKSDHVRRWIEQSLVST